MFEHHEDLVRHISHQSVLLGRNMSQEDGRLAILDFPQLTRRGRFIPAADQ
jgi:hypothetical protein